MRKMLLFIGILCLIVFMFFYYKTLKNGNNISSKTQEEIIDYILNDIKSYTANMEVIVYSNKTEIKYKIKQEVNEEKSIQEILEPDNIKGLKIEMNDKSLRVTNTKLNLEKIYEEYEAILNNSFFLNVFIEDYKINESKNFENGEEIILETKLEKNINTYARYKELHIDKKTKKIKELKIYDNSKNIRVNIKYNDIEIK